jgi:succinate dehydrogenase / fumarate reductase cytochrome b subunit
MALSGLFLLLFLAQHAFINSTSMFNGGETFNEISHFMGTNPLIQYVMQPVLALGVLFHLLMGMALEIQNRKARNKKYAMNKGGKNSSWVSRNMIITGIMILLFLGLHFLDFWFPELKTKFIEGDMTGKLAGHEGYRYYAELNEKFHSVWRTALYVLSFIFLALHLMHGFVSAFQSVGFRHNRYTPLIKLMGKAYAILIPLAFIAVALFHHFNQIQH